MTLPPERIGDKGQRYEVHATGYPKDGTNTIGWSASLKGAEQLAAGIALAPGCTSTEIFDRTDNKLVMTNIIRGRRK